MIIQKIVIVEDDFIIRLFIESILSDAGFDVVGVADSFEDAMQILETTIPDLIMMDIGLRGDKDGIETAVIIREKYDIPIVFVTGNSDINTLTRAKNTNPLGFIAKPIDATVLKEAFKGLKVTSS